MNCVVDLKPLIKLLRYLFMYSSKNLSDIWFKITHWETWPYMIKYIPLSPFWFWYCLKSRGFWFFTPSNPTLSFGGFEGERKMEMYDQLPKELYPSTVLIDKTMNLSEVHLNMEKANLKFPVAVKPDAGMMGFMFRQLKNSEELEAYHKVMPCDYIVQEYVSYPLEVSIFYFRFPGNTKGTITGFLKKEFLQVVGDGKSTTRTLIENYERVRFRKAEMLSKHENNLEEILAPGEIYCLSYALNLSRGGKLINLEHEKNEALVNVFDKISLYTETFYYGRYDIKCASIESLKAGKDFSILEYNGSGAEPHHIYGNGNTLLEAWKILLRHWSVLYKISNHNHRNGHEKWGFKKGYSFLKAAKKHFKILKNLDAKFEV